MAKLTINSEIRKYRIKSLIDRQYEEIENTTGSVKSQFYYMSVLRYVTYT